MKKVLVTCTGIMVADIILADLPKVCQPGELIFVPGGISLHVGGHAANVPIDLIKLGLREGEVSTVGTVGKDPYGDLIESTLAGYGVQTHMTKIMEAETAKSVIFVVRGEDRRVYHSAGANYFLNPDRVKAILEKEKPLVFYIGGAGFLGRFDEQLSDVLKVAKAQNCLTFLDPVPPYRHGWGHVLEAIKLVDIFHCNTFEASDMTGIRDFRGALSSISGEGAKLAIVSDGENGLVAAGRRMMFEMPAFKVPVIDPTGAGDAFCAGIIQALLEMGQPPDISKLSADDVVNILLRGEAAGAACVAGLGTTSSVTAKKVDELMFQQGPEIRKLTKVS